METTERIQNNSSQKSKGKSSEYPIIYSYIYEREAEDIRRLYNEHKRNLPKRKKVTIETKTIMGFKIENGTAVAIYKEESAKVIVKKKK